MQRRGLNFLTDQHEENLDEDSIQTVQHEVDNIAPKIIGILGLSGSCDTKAVRDQLVNHCVEYMETLRNAGMTKKQMKEQAKEGEAEVKPDELIDTGSPFQAFIGPNAGSNSLSSKR